MTTARSRTAPLSYGRRRALIHTNALRREHVKPRGETFALVKDVNCDTEVLAGYTSTHAPLARVQTIRTFRESSYTIVDAPTPGDSGASFLVHEEEVFEVGLEPLVQAQIPEQILVGDTLDIFLIGINFRETPIDTFSTILLNGDPDTLATLGEVFFVSDPESEGLEDLPPDSTVVKVEIDIDENHRAKHSLGPVVPEAYLNYRVVRS